MGQIDAATGEVLEMLARGLGARRVLEVGTGTGDAALRVVKALPADGMVITLERNESRAIAARSEFERAGVAPRVAVMIGDASRYLHKISGPFDLVLQHVDLDQQRVFRPRLMELLRERGLLASTRPSADGEITLTVKR